MFFKGLFQSESIKIENKNKIMKQIIGPNPTMDDFTIATLIMEDVRSLNEKVKKMYPTRSNPTREAGFPKIDGCVKDVRIVVRNLLSIKNKEFNIDGKELSLELFDYQQEAKKKRSHFFYKIISSRKFIRAPHKFNKT